MLGYYVLLGLKSLRRSIALTTLMVLVIGVGIAAQMSVLTIYRALTGDPIPRKSQQLFVPQLDSLAPTGRAPTRDPLPEGLSDTDVQGLTKSPIPSRQAAMYVTSVIVTPKDLRLHPFEVRARVTGADFFALFEVPLRFGAPWTREEEAARAHLIVIGRRLNERLFGGRNSVGATLVLNDQAYRVAGVLGDWQPMPRFYDLSDALAGTEDILLPLSVGLAQQLPFTHGAMECPPGDAELSDGWERFLAGRCTWLTLWVELPTRQAAQAYRSWLSAYAAQQTQIGRFHRPPATALYNVPQWLEQHHLVSGETHLLLLMGAGFLGVCLLNATGLMLARVMRAGRDIAVRRALGARRGAVLAQYLIETGVVGGAGGLVGLGLTALTLHALRQLVAATAVGFGYPPDYGQSLLRLDASGVALTVLLAIVATVLAGLYPSWRAVNAAPAPQLKAL